MPTKLCPHTLNSHGDIYDFVQAGSPAVKLVNDYGSAAQLLAVNPGVILIGRIYETYDANGIARSGASPLAEAQAWVQRQSERYNLNPLIKIWEGPNEPVFGNAGNPDDMQAMAWYAQFEAERLRLLAAIGLRGVVGNFPTGTPDLGMWPAFLPALAAVATYNGYLGLHEYSSPWMWWLTGSYQAGNCPDQFPTGPGEGDEGWLTLRYRKVYRQYLIPNGLGSTPLFITECGLDSIGPVCQGYTSGGWRVHPGFWNSYNGQFDPIDYWRGTERDPERYYAEQLAWYDQELQKDSYVQGATIFTVGDSSWANFDIGGTRVSQYVRDYIRSIPVGPPLPGPQGGPEIIPVPTDQPPGGGAEVSTPPPSDEVETISVPVSPGARIQPAPNLLVNSGFEAGEAYFADNTRELATPIGWAMSFKDANIAPLPRQTQPFGRPFTALINNQAVTPEDRERVFAGSAYVWKVATPISPVWVTLTQTVAGLTAGKKYRLSVAFLPDMLVREDPRLFYASDPDSSEVQLSVEDTASDWKNLLETPAGRYATLTLQFSSPSEKVTVALDLRSRFRLPLAAWYVDELSLEEVA